MCGPVTAMAAFVAIAASTALPPCARIAIPAWVASWSADATIPPGARVVDNGGEAAGIACNLRCRRAVGSTSASDRPGGDDGGSSRRRDRLVHALGSLGGGTADELRDARARPSFGVRADWYRQVARHCMAVDACAVGGRCGHRVVGMASGRGDVRRARR